MAILIISRCAMLCWRAGRGKRLASFQNRVGRFLAVARHPAPDIQPFQRSEVRNTSSATFWECFSEQQTCTNPNQVWPVLGARHKTHQQIDTCPVNLRMCSRQVGSISQKTDEGSQERFYPFSWGWPNKRHFPLKHQPTIIHNFSSLQIWNRLLQFRPMATKKWSKS